MRRLLTVAVALCALVAVGVVLARPTPVIGESVSIDVPAQVSSDATLTIDAMLFTVSDAAAPAPGLLLAHGFGSDRRALDDTAEGWARRGYVVLTWSARGFGRSGGTIGLNNPAAEIADIAALVDLLAARPEVLLDAPGDPRVGIAGGSYGGGAALLAAIDEPRIDAVVSVAAWNNLSTALAPNRAGGIGVPKDQWLSLLFTAGGLGGLGGVVGSAGAVGGGADGEGAAETDVGDLAGLAGSPAALASLTPDLLSCGRFAAELCAAYQASAAGEVLTDRAIALLDRASPAGRLGAVTAPTMLIQGQDDTLFDLGQSLANAEELTDAGTPVALRWIDAGHTGLGEIGSRADALAATWLARWLPVDGAAVEVEAAGDDAVETPFIWTDGASGEPQPATTLPPPISPDGAQHDGGPDQVLDLALTSGGGLAGDQPGPSDLSAVDLIHPAGGLPAAVSTLPGLGGLGALLPTIDLPGQSVTFTTPALPSDLTIVGSPVLSLGGTSSDARDGGDLSPAVFIKLYDVSPGGSTSLLQSDVNPVRLDGNATVELGPVAHRLLAGNRLRLTVATTDQGFDTGRDADVIELPVGPDSRLRLPLADTITSDPLPAAVRILLPVILVMVLASTAAWVFRRRDRRLAATVPGAGPAPVVIRGLAKRYADGKVAVDGIDLTVERGQVFGLLGPNGAGKTTTMRMLLGLVHPSSGTVELLGRPVRSGHPVFHRIGVLVEGPGFAPYLTGRQNLHSHWRAGGRPADQANLDRALAVADLGTAIDKPTRSYSHGMRQRLAIAQALLGDPELLVLDEPTDGLDPEQIRAMRELLARLGSEGVTVLVSSHLLAEVEQMCTHVAVMQSGRVLATGPVAELMGATQSIVVVVDDQTAARSALDDLLDPGQVGVEGSGLVITLNGTPVPQIVSALTRAGVAVNAVTPRGRLEDTFLALTNAGAVPREEAVDAR